MYGELFLSHVSEPRSVTFSGFVGLPGKFCHNVTNSKSVLILAWHYDIWTRCICVTMSHEIKNLIFCDIFCDNGDAFFYCNKYYNYYLKKVYLMLHHSFKGSWMQGFKIIVIILFPFIFLCYCTCIYPIIL